MHTVIAHECTGCELCLPPCPMDCINLEVWKGKPDGGSPWSEYPTADRDQARRRTHDHDQRLAADQQKKTTNQARQQQNMRDEITAAVARSKAKQRK
ncbi:MAG: hypothetical protein IME93_00055 [Proteobacteria bacterium]|nr:hypothetical protein [Pseudomonadota bacterium]